MAPPQNSVCSPPNPADPPLHIPRPKSPRPPHTLAPPPPAPAAAAGVSAVAPPLPARRPAPAIDRHPNQEGLGPRGRRLGQDIKVTAVRRGRHLDVTVNVAVHPLAAPSPDTYDAALSRLHAELDDVASRALGSRLDHRLLLNCGDANPYQGKRHYLLGSGSCLEFGEEGFVCRGNTASGLIPIHRPKSAEAAF